MESWDDEALILSVRRHGEHAGLCMLLTRTHGRHAGLLPGAWSKSRRGVVQPGNRVRAVWRARLSEQLGTLTLELIEAHCVAALADPGRLAALSSACALAELALPERQPQPASFAALSALLSALAAESWPTIYVHFERALLSDLGFGLDLSVCALTGVTEDLAYVSPKSGRAVSRSAGQPWAPRLLPLPRFLVAGGEGDCADIRDGLRLTGHFLDRHVLSRPLPARTRLVDRFRGENAISGAAGPPPPGPDSEEPR
jgi:DNA repair protein RecO (recombination protein O)